MSRKGNCLDTAMVESFFGHLKEEFYRHKRFSSPIEFTTELDTYIHWYNHVRIREQLQGLSPVQYRAQFRQSSGTAVMTSEPRRSALSVWHQ